MQNATLTPTPEPPRGTSRRRADRRQGHPAGRRLGPDELRPVHRGRLAIAPTDDAFHLPADKLPLYGTPQWDAMTETERHAYSRHECAALCGAGIWFENKLMQIVLRHLAELPVTDPSHRYLLVEVADECRHSTMFGEYIRRAGTPGVRAGAASTTSTSTRCPADGRWATCSSSRSRSCSTCATGPRCATRRCTRSRARSRASTCSRRRATSASPRRTSPRCGRRCPTHERAEAAARRTDRGRVRRRASWSTTTSPTTLGIAGGGDTARANPHHRARIVDDLAKLADFLTELGVIDATNRHEWTEPRPRRLIALRSTDRPTSDGAARSGGEQLAASRCADGSGHPSGARDGSDHDASLATSVVLSSKSWPPGTSDLPA